jgi:hypothetical protein
MRCDSQWLREVFPPVSHNMAVVVSVYVGVDTSLAASHVNGCMLWGDSRFISCFRDEHGLIWDVAGDGTTV